MRITAEKSADVQPVSHAEAQFDIGRRVTSQTDRDVPPDYFWKSNRYIVFRKDNKGDEQFHLYRVDVTNPDANKQPDDLTPFPNVSATLIDDLRGISDTDILVSVNRRDPRIYDVYRINVIDPDPNKMCMAVENRFGAVQWFTDNKGLIRAAIAREGTQTILYTRPDEKSDFKLICATDFTESIDPQGFTPDDKAFYAVSNVDRDKAAVVIIDPETGLEINGPPLFEHPDVDAYKVEFSRKRRAPTDVMYCTWKMERSFFDDKTAKLFGTLYQKFPGYLVSLTACDDAEQKFIVTVASDRSPGRRYLFDTRTTKLRKLADVAPLLREKQLARMQWLQYSSDGVAINGYLALPPGRRGKNLPTIIYPHGGPWQRDAWGYNPDVQFFANRGYAVLQMNFRGSFGYGKRFWEAGFKQWGGKMQDDVTAGARWLVAQGIADPKRIAIYGESYGGYAALAGVTFTPDVYCAGADRAGISNLIDFLEPLPGRWQAFLPELYAKVGNPTQDGPMLTAHSPLCHVDQIRVPVLIAHGGNDQRVNIDQSKRMVIALEQAGLRPKCHWFDNQGHYFDTEASIAFHEELSAFLEEHLR